MFTNPFFVLCVFIKGIQAAIKQEQEYNQAFKTLSGSKIIKSYFATPFDPKIEKIQYFTPFMCKEAKELYNVSQEYFIPIDLLVEFTIKSGLGAMGIRGIIEKKMKEETTKINICKYRHYLAEHMSATCLNPYCGPAICSYKKDMCSCPFFERVYNERKEG